MLLIFYSLTLPLEVAKGLKSECLRQIVLGLDLTMPFPNRCFSAGLDNKESACNAGDPGSIPGSEKTHWRRTWQPAPVFLPGDSQDRGAWRAAVYGVTKSQTRPSDSRTHTFPNWSYCPMIQLCHL